MTKDEISEATKRRLGQSLKRLMEQKPFEKISVREILEDADVTRSTFYYHFEDTYDLMKWTFETELIALLKQSKDCATWEEGLLLMFRYMQENRKVCLCAYNSVGRDILQRIFLKSTKATMRQFVDAVSEDIPSKPEHKEYITEFYTMALVSAAAQWLLNPKGRSPEDVMELIDISIHGNIEAALRRSAES